MKKNRPCSSFALVVHRHPVRFSLPLENENYPMILATILEDYNGIIQTIETFVSEEGADLVVRSICDMLTKEANRKLRCDISESKKSVQKIEKEARRAVEVLSNKETVAVQIEENFKNDPKISE